jgi:hypothetical protein
VRDLGAMNILLANERMGVDNIVLGEHAKG